MILLYAFGPSWARYVATQLFALFSHNQGPIKVYLFSDALPPEAFERFQKVCQHFGPRCTVEFMEVGRFYKANMHSRLVRTRRFTDWTMYRLTAPWFIPEDRLLYLDADTLVCGDLSPLFNMDFEGAMLAGCTDIGISARHKAKIKVPEDSIYVNAGMLMMDFKRIRDEKVFDDWVRLLKTEVFPCNDQDCINRSLLGKIKLVSNEWNSSVSTGFHPDPKVIHYAGPKDPWIARLPLAERWYVAEKGHAIATGPMPVNKIPSDIFYGWFGGLPKPPKIQECIASWRRVMPNCGIIELNASNCDLSCNAFVREAYKARKWGFVWDYFRMKAMHDHGGITLDADVELVAPLDPFLQHRFFSGQEINDRILITATMGSERGHPLVKALLDYYDTAIFDFATVKPNTDFITKIFNAFIVERTNDGKIILEHDGHLYPQAYFCNYDHRRRRVLPSPNAHAVHWFSGSWKKASPAPEPVHAN